ncbi:unnamed protein product [marine sediment metagenome]|uniref:Uncharacterized protein n=1 Tax=marine sediment metagenome TaxID=412755 RepID=X1AMQ0_9ZZZZ
MAVLEVTHNLSLESLYIAGKHQVIALFTYSYVKQDITFILSWDSGLENPL